MFLPDHLMDIQHQRNRDCCNLIDLYAINKKDGSEPLGNKEIHSG